MISPAATALFTLSLSDKKEHELKLPVRKDQMMAARWSSGENHILVRGTPQDGNEEWYVVNTESGESKPIGQKVNAKVDRPLSISPDRKTLYFVRAGSIIAHDLEKGKERVLDSSLSSRIHPFVMLSPSWDGKYLAFYLYGGRGASCIFILPTSGGESREVYRTDRELGLQRICWSRDGKYIYAGQSSNQPNKVELWRVPLDGGTAELTGLSSTNLHAPEFHPDGKTLVFSSPDEQLPMEIWALDNLLQKRESDFADQAEIVAQARMRLATLGKPVEKGIVALQVGSKLQDRVYGRAISRDGRFLAYTNHGLVFIHDLLMGKERLLVARATPEESYSDAAISPDGKQITYAKRMPGKSVELYVIGSDSSSPRQLAGGKDPRVWPWGWSPDGKYILAESMSQDGKHEAVLVSVVDGSSRLIASNMDWGRISPDGRYIAFVKVPANEIGQRESREIFVSSVTGGRGVRLVVGRMPVWAPDGKKVLFIRQRTGGRDLWSIPVANGEPSGDPEFVKGALDGVLLDVTKDGDYYYQTQSYVNNLYTAEINPQTAKLASRPRQIPLPMQSPFTDIMGGAAWSPDGKSLAYFTMRGQEGAQKLTVVIRSITTGEERELPLKGDIWPAYRKPQWFPDGSSFCVYAWDGKLWQIDKQTGACRMLLDSATITRYQDREANPGYRASVVLAPNGRTIYALSRDEVAHQTRIVRRDLSGGPETELCRVNADVIGGLSLAPGGDRLVFVAGSAVQEPKRNWAIMTLATNGGEPREVYRASQWIHATVWNNDGRRLLFIARPAPVKSPVADVYAISADGGEPQPLGIELHDLYYLSMNPDGTRIAFSDEQWDNQLWVLKNLFGEGKSK
jgi:Tol biopolymer transport system component